MAAAPRRPAVAGQFYAGDGAALRREIDLSFTDPRGPGQLPSALPSTGSGRRVRAAVVPHAGYVFSGPIAAHAFAAIARDAAPEAVLVIGVDHHGVGGLASLSARPWLTPLGELGIAADLLGRLQSPPLDVDEAAHAMEHSIEVELPFVQRVLPGVPFVPLQVRFSRWEALERVAAVVRRATEGHDVLVIASSDFSHYEPAELAREHDERMIARILAGDARGLYDLVRGEDLSMCGIAPVTVLLQALSGTIGPGELLRYGHSGEAAPMETVVGYASIVFGPSAVRPPVK